MHYKLRVLVNYWAKLEQRSDLRMAKTALLRLLQSFLARNIRMTLSILTASRHH